MKRHLALWLVVVMFFAPTLAAAQESHIAVFQDPMLEKRVRKMLDRPEGDIYVSELVDITDLNFNNFDYPFGEIPEEEKIRDLTDLKYFPNLEKLDIGRNAISDLSPLAALEKLYYIEAPQNYITDLSPLANMTQLTWAVFWENEISDLTPVANLVNLETFSVFSNNVTDVSPLANLTNLTILEVYQNPVEDMSPVSGILERIDKMNAAPSDTAPTDSKENKTGDLDASHDQTSDTTAIVFDDPVLEARIREAIGKPEGDVTYGDAKSYQGDLYANYNWQPGEEKIHSIEVLRYFTNIFKFEAADQDIRDLSPLSELKNLGILWIRGSPISDLSPIAGLENLVILQISDTGEALDLAPLAGLKNLGTLLASNDHIEDISALAELSNLDVLDLSNNNISILSPLSGLTKLTSLRLAGNPVTDFEPIRELIPNITDRDFEPLYADEASDTPIEIAEPAFEAALRRAMNIYDRPITERDAYLVREIELTNEKTEESEFSDISPLKYFVNLEKLTFNANPITDISALQGLTKLNSLYISFSQVSDLAPLSGLVNLWYLNFDFCPVEDLSPLAGLVNLRGLGADNCLVRDLTPLAGLANLNNLSLKGCLVEDVSPLANLTNLKLLILEGCPVADFSPLAGIYPNLEVKDFEVSGEAIRAVPPAQSNDIPSAVRNENSMFEDPMFEKRVRKMLQRPEGDIDPSELIGITELIFNNWDYPNGEIPEEEKIHSLADLKYFPNLERLDIGFNAVSDLSPISALNKLYYLEAPKNNISDLSPLADMTQLTWAVFWENDISDLTPVSNLVNLETFSVFSNNVSDISPLANLKKLSILELHDNPFEDFSPVAEIYPNLREKDFTLDEPEQKENTSADSASVIEGWRYDESTRTLTIDGDAAMIAYQPDQENAESATRTNAPWATNLAQIEYIIVGDDVTLISDYAFAYASALKKITIGKGVSTLGFRCLYRCGNWDARENLEIIVNCAAMPALGKDVMGYTWDNPQASLIIPVSQIDQWREALAGSGLSIVVQ